MKLRKLTAFLLAAVLSLTLAPAVFADRTPSEWFVEEMDNANMNGILTPSAMKDFRRPLTREEFCEIVVIMTERTLGRALLLPPANPFTDTDSDFVLKAYHYGIITGTSATTFHPERELRREEVAAMMIRSLQLMQTELRTTLLDAPAAALPFDDQEEISDYAVEYMRYAYSNGIMRGNGDGTVTPRANISSQECAAVVNRTYESSRETIYTALPQIDRLERAADDLNIGFAYGDLPSAVSRDILLPLSAPGGVIITWNSSDPYVISPTGEVSPPTHARNVTLTAVLSLSGQTRIREFHLTTSARTGDDLLYENALNNIEIGFWNAGDTLNSVTGGVFLPTSSLGLDVTWITSRPDVITANGRVTVPNSSSVIDVTLTARIDAVHSRTFTLRVRNPAYTASDVKLHGVEIGMTTTQVNNILGISPQSTHSLGSGETWRVYYSGNYASFIAVAFSGNTVAGVYSMVQNWQNSLRDSSNNIVAPEDVRASATGVNIEVYTDANSTPRQYAALLYDASTAVNTQRALNSTEMEQLILAFVNAYRAQYIGGSMALVTAESLTNMARSYVSTYFNSGIAPSGTAASRAQTFGYEASQFMAELPQSGGAGPQDILHDIVRYAQPRANLLNTSAAVAGIGYAGNANRSYAVIELGGTAVLANATASGTGVSGGTIHIGAGQTSATISISLTPTGTGREPVRIDRSNANITIAASPPGTIDLNNIGPGINAVGITVTAASGASGTSYINVTGLYSGRQIQIPVTFSTSYAQSVTIGGTNKTYIAGAGTTLQLTATAAPLTGASAVQWYTNTSGVTVSSGGLVTISSGFAGTSFQVTAWAPSSATQNTMSTTTARDTVTIHVPAISVSPTAAQTLQVSGQPRNFTLTVNPAAPASITATVAYTNSNANIVTLSAASGTTTVVTAARAGTAVITATVSYVGAANAPANNPYRITRTVNVTVVGAPAEATDITLSSNPSNRQIDVLQPAILTAAVVPAGVTPAPTIYWEIRQGADLVTVSGGTTGSTFTVVGRMPGTVRIEARVQNAAGAWISREITITVKTPSISLDSAKVVLEALRPKVGESSHYQLSAPISPLTAVQGVIWEASVSDEDLGFNITPAGMVTISPIEAGLYRVVITARSSEYGGVFKTEEVAIWVVD